MGVGEVESRIACQLHDAGDAPYSWWPSQIAENRGGLYAFAATLQHNIDKRLLLLLFPLLPSLWWCR